MSDDEYQPEAPGPSMPDQPANAASPRDPRLNRPSAGQGPADPRIPADHGAIPIVAEEPPSLRAVAGFIAHAGESVSQAEAMTVRQAPVGRRASSRIPANGRVCSTQYRPPHPNNPDALYFYPPPHGGYDVRQDLLEERWTLQDVPSFIWDAYCQANGHDSQVAQMTLLGNTAAIVMEWWRAYQDRLQWLFPATAPDEPFDRQHPIRSLIEREVLRGNELPPNCIAVPTLAPLGFQGNRGQGAWAELRIRANISEVNRLRSEERNQRQRKPITSESGLKYANRLRGGGMAGPNEGTVIVNGEPVNLRTAGAIYDFYAEKRALDFLDPAPGPDLGGPEVVARHPISAYDLQQALRVVYQELDGPSTSSKHASRGRHPAGNPPRSDCLAQAQEMTDALDVELRNLRRQIQAKQASLATEKGPPTGTAFARVGPIISPRRARSPHRSPRERVEQQQSPLAAGYVPPPPRLPRIPPPSVPRPTSLGIPGLHEELLQLARGGARADAPPEGRPEPPPEIPFGSGAIRGPTKRKNRQKARGGKGKIVIPRQAKAMAGARRRRTPSNFLANEEGMEPRLDIMNASSIHEAQPAPSDVLPGGPAYDLIYGRDEYWCPANAVPRGHWETFINAPADEQGPWNNEELQELRHKSILDLTLWRTLNYISEARATVTPDQIWQLLEDISYALASLCNVSGNGLVTMREFYSYLMRMRTFMRVGLPIIAAYGAIGVERAIRGDVLRERVRVVRIYGSAGTPFLNWDTLLDEDIFLLAAQRVRGWDLVSLRRPRINNVPQLQRDNERRTINYLLMAMHRGKESSLVAWRADANRDPEELATAKGFQDHIARIAGRGPRATAGAANSDSEDDDTLSIVEEDGEDDSPQILAVFSPPRAEGHSSLQASTSAVEDATVPDDFWDKPDETEQAARPSGDAMASPERKRRKEDESG
jgi:hypothetical protein